jgi:hypothetical protein
MEFLKKPDALHRLSIHLRQFHTIFLPPLLSSSAIVGNSRVAANPSVLIDDEASELIASLTRFVDETSDFETVLHEDLGSADQNLLVHLRKRNSLTMTSNTNY